MSIHGIQKFLPFILNSKGKPIGEPADYLVGLIDCLNQKRAGERLVTFSRLAWPLIMIQGSVSSHIIVDDVGISGLDIKITNAPRQATIGHVLRNLDSNSYIEMLNRIKSLILYTEDGKSYELEDVTDEETEEYKNITIKGLMNPNIISAVEKLVPYLKETPISKYALLESVHSVELGLKYAQEYKKSMILIKGIKTRWESLKDLIQEPFNEWMNELHAKIKDEELRYKSIISKEEKNIDKEYVQQALKRERDKIDQNSLQEKKSVLEKIGGSFLSFDNILEELRSSNKQFLNTDSFRTVNIDRAVKLTKQHISFIKDNISKIQNTVIPNLEDSLERHKETLVEIDKNAEQQYKTREVELKTQLAQRDTRIQTISEASEGYIDDLKDAEKTLNNQLDEIIKIINQKIKDCNKDLDDLSKWGLSNEKTEIAQGVLRVFMPIYIGLFEDEEEDERLVFSLPCIIENSLDITQITDGFSNFKAKVEEIVEDDMKIRSNFEFTMDKLNLLENKEVIKLVTEGIELLNSEGINTDIIDQKYIDELKKII
ncbi:MAG: hypothetical protein GF364_21615 [Candidatus Lokiarchaeota archaeon]|nr:hypothetical protein [Candidatus Lokiarchaeota archaeon]